MTRVVIWLTISGILCCARASAAGQTATPRAPAASPTTQAGSEVLPFAFDGPPAPVPPDVISRDASGRATVRAVRLDAPLRVDGRLDEAVYASVLPMSDFIQLEPTAGAPATEKTEVWVFFDRDRVYVSFRCWETRPDRMIATEMRRDGNIIPNDHVEYIFDTFYDRRNAFRFQVSPIGGRRDTQITDERSQNVDWNPIWEFKAGRFDGGWTVETAVPFKSLRYRPGSAQIWGFNAQRTNKWKNELSFLTRLPHMTPATLAIVQVSSAATMVDLDAPAGSRNLEIKPYAVSNLTSNLNATPKVSNDLGGHVGVDAKYGVTQNLTADFTYNTDFGQVEADEQQVNLTRFSLFFPEKREFFLENRGMFDFGGVTGIGGGGGNMPVLFYSRRIGLNQSREVPVRAGGRLTGRIGRYSLGVLNIQSGDEPVSSSLATNFSVVRLKRDLLRRSSIGVLFTGRSVGQAGTGTNTAYGLDGTFAFFDHLVINTYWARTRTTGLSGEDASYRAQLDYSGDRYGLQLERLIVGDNFKPEVGYVQRNDMRRNVGQFRFSPRPKSIKSIRKFSGTASIEYVENGAGRLETRNREADFGIDFQNSDQFTVKYSDTYELLASPFRIAPGVTIPVGGYDFGNLDASFTFGQQRAISGSLSAGYGAFYGGHKKAIGVNGGLLNIPPHFTVQPSLSINWVDLPQGSFRTQLIGSRATYNVTPLMFVSALLQYNYGNHTVSTNARLRWEYRPGSELFVVYNDERNTLVRGFPGLEDRALIVKINRLFSF